MKIEIKNKEYGGSRMKKNRPLKSLIVFVPQFIFSIFLVSTAAAQLSQSSDSKVIRQFTSPEEKYVNGTSPLQSDNTYIKKNKAQQFWKIMPHYESQLTNSSCSSTTMSMVFNSLGYDFDLRRDSGENITQNTIVNSISNPQWKKQTANNGGGVGIRKLKEYTEEALQHYGLDGFALKIVSLKSESTATINKIRKILIEIENSKTDRVVFNFDQGHIFSEEEVGHFAPFGAFDEENDRVLIMDPDRQLYEPYWVPLKLMVQAMKNRGLLILNHQSSQNVFTESLIE